MALPDNRGRTAEAVRAAGYSIGLSVNLIYAPRNQRGFIRRDG